ncbi:MAG: tetratricopeptide repeat protein [Pseudomonadota bacterium]
MLLIIHPAIADEFADVTRLMRSGQTAEALVKIDAFLQKNPRDMQMRFVKGVALTEQGKTVDAIAVFTKLTEDHPDLPEPYNNLAVLFAGSGQYEKARTALDMAIRTNPSYATAYENLGDVHAKLASQAYDKALQLDSSNSNAKSKLTLLRNVAVTVASNDGNPKAAGKGNGRAVAAAAPVPAATPTPAPATMVASAPATAPAVSAPAPKVVAAAPAPKAVPPVPPTPKVIAAPPPIAVAKADSTSDTGASRSRIDFKPDPKPQPATEPRLYARADGRIDFTSELKQNTVPETRNDGRNDARMMPVSLPSSSDNAEVMATVNDWAEAWSAQDVKRYLSHYGDAFETPKGESRKAWMDERTSRIAGKGRISVKVASPQVAVNGTQATVKFRQLYASDQLQADSKKTLVLIKQNGKWQIKQERTGA